MTTDLSTRLAQPWDLVVVGGGITGAGIALQAAQRGWRVLLVEQRDFAWGTSSRSSKLVHGGLRYVRQGQLGLTRESVLERERLLRTLRGLVTPLGFVFPLYRGARPGRWLLQAGLAVYDALAGQWRRHHQPVDALRLLAPHIAQAGLEGGMCYQDAQTDDARLVLRVLQEAQALGAVALNYLAAEELLRDSSGTLRGLRVRDARRDQVHSVHCPLIVNATGAWADRLRMQQGAAARLRPLRGSHLVLPGWRLPLAQAISWMHPQDGRPVFAIPWEGATLVGTTDLDHRDDLQQEAAITPAEVRYLMGAVHDMFPSLALTPADIRSTFAGVRPVIDTGKADPSQEGRDHAVWLEQGLLTVTGGKLTTFGRIAQDALRALTPLLPAPRLQASHGGASAAPRHAPGGTDAALWQRLQGRYGALAPQVLACALPGDCSRIEGTPVYGVELRWAARHEAVLHLDDLLLRRTRLGLLLPRGGAELLPRVRLWCQGELGWDDDRWAREVADYQTVWQRHYSVPHEDSHG